MPKNYYLPADDGGRAAFFEQFAVRLSNYNVLLDINSADLASVQDDAAAFRYALKGQQQMQATAQQWTAYKNLLLDGGAGSAAIPAAVVLPTPAPAAVAPGIISRVTGLAARIKSHKNYSEAIGQDLGIVGAEQVDDPNAWKPILGIDFQAGHPVIRWKKGGASALELWVDRSDGKGFAFLAINLSPPWPDSAPLPTAGTSAIWKYRAIYRRRDDQVGQWSDILTVTVGGQ